MPKKGPIGPGGVTVSSSGSSPFSTGVSSGANFNATKIHNDPLTSPQVRALMIAILRNCEGRKLVIAPEDLEAPLLDDEDLIIEVEQETRVSILSIRKRGT